VYSISDRAISKMKALAFVAKAARKSADDLQEKLKGEGLLVEVEPVHLLN
jgi:hypothetical protein